MGIHPRRLRDLTDEVDQLHHESMRTIQDTYEEVHLGALARDLGPARRSFLKQMAVGGAVLTVGSQLVPFGRILPPAWAQEEGDGPDDLEIAAFAASVELAAAQAYLAAVETGLLTEPVTELARLFGSHHSAHAAALSGFLAEPIEEPNAGLLAELTPELRAAEDEAALLEIALGVEEAAAATYYAALGTLEQKAATAVATILPVESQHAVVLAAALGLPAEEYLPAFQRDTGAVDASEYPLPDPEDEDPQPSTTTTQPSGGGGDDEEGGSGGGAESGSEG